MSNVVSNSTNITYLAEGGANVVYRVTPPEPASIGAYGPSEYDDDYGPSTPPPTELDAPPPPPPDPEFAYLSGKLLRLRKEQPGGTSTGVGHAQRDFERIVAPLLARHVGEDHVVSQTLVEVPWDLTDQLNLVLSSMDSHGLRPPERAGTYLRTDEGLGLLVDDMSPRPAEDLVTLEIKPKWLAQSPRASEGARMCRDCALRSMRRAAAAAAAAAERTKRQAEEEELPTTTATDDFSRYLRSMAMQPKYCPLDLVSDDRGRVERAVREILDARDDITHSRERIEKRAVAFFLESPLLKQLRDLQVLLDPPDSPEDADYDEKLLLAMTLRDVSLFLRIPKDDDDQIDARFGDLDLKSPKKRKHWAELEDQLHSGGWYECSENLSRDTPAMCLISK